jgi:hypothetical protein
MSGSERYEHRDLDRRFAALAVVVLAALLAAGWIFARALLGRDRGVGYADAADRTPPPRLQANPPAELERLRARDRERLETYGWIDRDEGLVRIPILRAMELVAREAAEEER